MLVLTRRQDETIVIGQCVAVQVLGIEGGRVRLGITAPAEVSIRRAELEPLRPALTDGDRAQLNGPPLRTLGLLSG
ncbi:MAG: carbon storage regulator [Planctomycetaceae bacterium]|nr:carbon storage regulator [Planctomycetaceae bacterium]